MRKYGLVFTIFGGALGTILLFVRQTAWFRSASATNLSESAEFVEAAFWTGWIILALGLLMLLFSLRKKDEPVQEEEVLSDDNAAYADEYAYPAQPYEQPDYAEQPAFDNVNYAAPDDMEPCEDGSADDFRVPEDSVFRPPVRESFRDVWEEDDIDATRRVPELSEQEGEWVCGICGCKNAQYDAVCAVCGSTRGSRL